ncbi:MAG: glycosyltransferase family 8 protein [Eubacteriales bacterium]|nr:glycosyltransferase family 8 protein [Eubacteriales bacterium]
MDIVYNCDDGYVKYTAVSICSLYENNKNVKELRVHILGNNISENSKAKLSGLAEGYERKISFYDLCGFEELVKELAGGYVNAGKFTITALARLFAVRLLPSDIGRILYLDCDTLVLSELSGLWETELSGKVAAMAAEPTIYPEVKERLGLKVSDPYFNAGMILIDTELWAKEKILENAMDFYKENNGSLPFSDQDLINFALKDRIKIVSQTYNFITNYYYQSFRYLTKNVSWYANCMTKSEWKLAYKAPKIVHFAGDERPWIKGSFNPYKKEFMHYKSLTPWKDEPLVEGRGLYMLLYHVMNLMTRLCPGIRKLISGFYYKKFISDGEKNK